MSEIQNFPAENIPESERLGDKYGVKVAKAIYSRFQTNDSISREKIVENRSYARGLQSIDQYKTIMDPDWDKNNTTLINIDYSLTSPLPKLINIVLGGMINQDHKIHTNAIDRMSNIIRNSKRDELFGVIMKNKALEQLEMESGIPLTKKTGFIPENEEDIEMYMDTEYKLPIEIASEQIIDWELYQNDWNKITRRVLRDALENGEMCTRTYFDENKQIRVRYVDIVNYTESESNDPYSEDSDYQAELVYFSIRDIRRMSGPNISEQDLFYIAKSHSGQKRGNPA